MSYQQQERPEEDRRAAMRNEGMMMGKTASAPMEALEVPMAANVR